MWERVKARFVKWRTGRGIRQKKQVEILSHESLMDLQDWHDDYYKTGLDE